MSTLILAAILRIRSRFHFSPMCCRNFVASDKMFALFNNNMYDRDRQSSSDASVDDNNLIKDINFDDLKIRSQFHSNIGKFFLNFMHY